MDSRQEPPIEYPEIQVPGKGKYRVKFGLGAQYTLETELGMDPAAFAKQLQEWAPKKQEDGTVIPGRVGPAFLFKVLSACLAGSGLQIGPRELADCFEFHQLQEIARIIAEAFSKTRWSAQTPLQEPATTQEQVRPN